MAVPLIPPRARAVVVDTARGRLRTLRAGPDRATGGASATSARPLVLIHGGGYDNSAISWFHMFNEFGTERDVLAVDLPGFGGSIDAEPVGGPAQMASVVAEVTDAEQTGPAVVFGCSMGGDVALNLALERPDLVAGLVLVGPGGLVPVWRNRPAQFAAWLGVRIPDLLLLPMTRWANRFVRSALDQFVHDREQIPQQVLAEFIAEAGHPRAGLGYARYNQATIGPAAMRNDLSERVGQIKVPTLFFHGALDAMVDPEGSRRAAAAMPRADLELVPDCGHWAQLERPDDFAIAARRLLARAR